ncbi:MAG TPA: MoaD/ThiS family protein [Phycisphaerae bacterium]|nr:MoaD/ThiS family protein [Phycisphaerae bacterium]
MKIEIEYVAQVRSASGVSSEMLELPEGSTVMDALAGVATKHPGKLASMLFGDDGSASKSILLFRGDDQVESATPVNAGDRLTILSPLAGG